MLSKKFLIGVGIDKFAGKNDFWQRKSATNPLATKSIGVASFRPLAITAGPGRHLGAFSS
jgi:hypothetical protein